MPSLILTVIGPDRPGLVNALSQAVAEHGGSWLESRMARLAGQFAGIVRVDAPESLLGDLQRLEQQGLRVIAQVVGAAGPVSSGQRLVLEVTGNDRPGIVRDVTRVLATCGVNIEELITNVESGSFSGGVLFRATAVLRAPGPPAIEAAKAGLEQLGNELMVDVRPAASNNDAV
jgi:glycine cleavage system regulatory protein